MSDQDPRRSCGGGGSCCLPLSRLFQGKCAVGPRDKRDRSNVQDFIVDGKKGETIVRMPGSVNGEQFVLQNCQDCTIYVFDHIAAVSVDDCVNCRLFFGPVKSSFFIRDCKECKVAVACQQFRTRDCFQIDTFLMCGTQPIIESSGRMRFACFSYYYTQLEQQFKSAGLSVFNNNWSNMHDFTPVPEEINFSYLPAESKMRDYVPIPEGEDYEAMSISDSADVSVVPITSGNRHKTGEESCLIVFFNDGGSSERVTKFIRAIKSQYSHCQLVQMKEVTMQTNDAIRVFGSDSYGKAVMQGPVIGLEINGASSITHCQACVLELMKGETGLVFVSQSPDAADTQLDSFYSFADMQMGV